MKGVVRYGHEKGDVRVDDVSVPEIAGDEIRIQVEAAGVCGSDVGAYLGKPEYDFMSVPGVLGHEAAGVVDSVGADIDNYESGDRVVLKPGNPCGDCFLCVTGEPNNCSNREPAVAAGGFSRYTVADADHVVRIPDSVPMLKAAITEPLAVTHRAVMMKGEVVPGDTVFIQGPGPMGAFSALVARYAGAEVVVSGLPSDEARLASLSEIGIETVTDPLSDVSGATEFVETYTSRGGFDVTVDATGVPAGLEGAQSVTRNGGRIVVIGVISQTVDLDMTDLVRSEIDIRPSHGSLTEDFIRSLVMLDAPNPLPVESLISTKHSPTDPAAAFDAFANAEAIKPVFDIDELVEP